MAEILGAVASGITVAGLLKLCLEAFELVQVAKKQSYDFDKLCLSLDLERARLFTWGQTLGLIGSDAEKSSGKLKASPFEGLVARTLRLILSLFEDGERLRKRYGCTAAEKQNEAGTLVTATATSFSTSTHVEVFAESFGNYGIRDKKPRQIARLASKARWVIDDRTKFSELIQEIRSFIDGLQDVTKSLAAKSQQERVLRYGVLQIRDLDTLNLLTEICQDDYPDISDAASTTMDGLTFSTHRMEDINVWMESTSNGIGSFDTDFESMNIAELQQLVRTLKAQGPGTSVLSDDHFYDSLLEDRAMKIKEQEEVIRKQEDLIASLQQQVHGRFEALQQTKPKTMRSALTPIKQSSQPSDTESDFRRNFRVSMDDPTSKVLPAALKKYNIQKDWREYSLYIVYGDTEQCLGPDEKPLQLFKELDKQGLKPMFMLKKIVKKQDESAVLSDQSLSENQDNSMWI